MILLAHNNNAQTSDRLDTKYNVQSPDRLGTRHNTKLQVIN